MISSQDRNNVGIIQGTIANVGVMEKKIDFTIMGSIGSRNVLIRVAFYLWCGL